MAKTVKFPSRNRGGSEFQFHRYHRKTLTIKELNKPGIHIFLKKKKKAWFLVVSSANQGEIPILDTQEYLDLQDKSTILHLA